MPARSHLPDAGAHGVRRLLCEHIEDALSALGGRRITDSEIHEARKALKKARAALRLMRDAISTACYRREDTALRVAARPLSAVRDARVMIDTLDHLEQRYGCAAKRAMSAAFRRDLARAQAATRRSVTNGATVQRQHVTALRATRRRVMAWRIRDHGWREIGRGLRRVYSRGRKAMKTALKTPLPECLHAWRKQAKYLWHELQTLEAMEPEAIGALAQRAQRLSDDLGDDHDLVVLGERVHALRSAFPGPDDAAALLALIDRSHRQLRKMAFLTGRRMYREKPRVFAAAMGDYWHRWQECESRRCRASGKGCDGNGRRHGRGCPKHGHAHPS